MKNPLERSSTLIPYAPAAILALAGLWVVLSTPSDPSRSSSPEIETARLLSLDLPSSGPLSSSPRYVNLERANLWKLTPPPPPKPVVQAAPSAVQEGVEQILKLHGTFVSGSGAGAKEKSEAVIRRLREDRVEAKHVGEEIEGYRIVDIQPFEVTLTPPGGSTIVKLRLFKALEDYQPKPLADFNRP